jgi:hypothetical protein
MWGDGRRGAGAGGIPRAQSGTGRGPQILNAALHVEVKAQSDECDRGDYQAVLCQAMPAPIATDTGKKSPEHEQPQCSSVSKPVPSCLLLSAKRWEQEFPCVFKFATPNTDKEMGVSR